MYLVKIEEAFEAAHNLRGYDGKCANLHGHNWIIEVEVAGEKLNELGILVDFKDVKRELKKILDEYDHRYLNEIPPFDKINPTAENLARFIYDEFKANKIFDDNAKLVAVTVFESPKSSVRYTE
ncbi:MAG: 6-carboxytetrahydropterin synthase QueD [Selenomonadaceae bacterium]|nr:6-carboxytetrahydropterin synthase QueD [Selenomonadaceae bacterium]